MRLDGVRRAGPWLGECPWTLIWVATAVLLTAVALLAGPGLAELVEATLATRDGLQQGQVWRLLSGPLVHSTWGHLLRDGSTVLLLGVVYERANARIWPWALALGTLLPAAAVLLAQPELAAYYGLSGTFNALMAVAVVDELSRRPPWWIRAVAVAYAAKLLFEGLSGGLLWPMELGQGVQPAPWAHLTGAAVGLTLALAERGRRRLRRARSDADQSPLRTSSSTRARASMSYGLATTLQKP